jgi:hypothetical protein
MEQRKPSIINTHTDTHTLLSRQPSIFPIFVDLRSPSEVAAMVGTLDQAPTAKTSGKAYNVYLQVCTRRHTWAMGMLSMSG